MQGPRGRCADTAAGRKHSGKRGALSGSWLQLLHPVEQTRHEAPPDVTAPLLPHEQPFLLPHLGLPQLGTGPRDSPRPSPLSSGPWPLTVGWWPEAVAAGLGDLNHFTESSQILLELGIMVPILQMNRQAQSLKEIYSES